MGYIKKRSFEVLGFANYSETRGLHPVGALARPHWISGYGVAGLLEASQIKKILERGKKEREKFRSTWLCQLLRNSGATPSGCARAPPLDIRLRSSRTAGSKPDQEKFVRKESNREKEQVLKKGKHLKPARDSSRQPEGKLQAVQHQVGGGKRQA